MSTDTRIAIVGGGQAGLATSYWLQHSDIEHVVFDRGNSGDTWRRRWDSFCLVTPNWSVKLPGFPYDGSDPDGFMPRDEIVDYVERYRDFVDPPMENPVEVHKVSQSAGGWRLETDGGGWTADQVIIAGGSFQTGRMPLGSTGVSDDVVQLHSSEYRNPDGLPEGSVLVVGSGQSGCQITDDLRQTGREVWLSVGSATRLPRRYRGRDCVAWLRDMGFLNMPMTQHPQGPEARYAANPQASGRDGGKEIDLREFGRSGVHLLGRFAGADRGSMRFESDVIERLDAADDAAQQMQNGIDDYISQTGVDAPADDRNPIDWAPADVPEELSLPAENIRSVIWATGYTRDFSWVENLPADDHGYPLEDRGVTDLPGLYFVGLHGMYTPGSGLFWGVGDDARYVVEHATATNGLPR